MNNSNSLEEEDKALSGNLGRTQGRSVYLLWLLWMVWVPFLIPVLIQFLAAPVSFERSIVTMAGVVLFFTIYSVGSWRHASQLGTSSTLSARRSLEVWLPISGLVALSCGLTVLNGKDWFVLFYFTSGYTVGRFPTFRALQVMSALMLLVVGLGLFITADWLVITQAAFTVALIGTILLCILRLVTISWELQAARAEIVRLAVTAERLRIARDLHDLLGHSLSLITLKSELAGRLVSKAPQQAVSEIKDIEQVARTTLQEVREAVSSYRQPNIANELHAAREILVASGIAYHYEGEEHKVTGILPSLEATLAWAVREGVTNVIRHSRAQECLIVLKQDKATAQIQIINDGVSLSGELIPQTSTGASSIGGGNGLHGLSERVVAHGGCFEAGFQPNGKFRLMVSVPVSSATKTD